MAKHTGIRKLTNGRFRARYFAGYNKEGKRQYPARTFDTQAEAIRWRSENVSAKTPGRYVEGRSLTVSSFITRWLETKKQSLRRLTLKSYKQSMRDYIEPYVGNVPLSRLAPTHIENLQVQLLDKGLSNTTVLYARTVFNQALKKAVRLNLIRVNPISLTDPPKKKKFDRYPLTVEEALRFLDACESARHGLLLRFALTTGLRPEEVCGLRWSDMELGSRGVVRVSQVVQSVDGGGWAIEKPKTESGERIIVFPADMVTRLQEHRRQQLQSKLRLGQLWADHDFVFAVFRGLPPYQNAVRKQFKKLLRQAGLPNRIRWYDLRHAFVTFSLVAGVDVKTVSKEAGHADVAFTLEHYGNVLDEMHQAASDKREGLLKSRARR